MCTIKVKEKAGKGIPPVGSYVPGTVVNFQVHCVGRTVIKRAVRMKN